MALQFWNKKKEIEATFTQEEEKKGLSFASQKIREEEKEEEWFFSSVFWWIKDRTKRNVEDTANTVWQTLINELLKPKKKKIEKPEWAFKKTLKQTFWELFIPWYKEVEALKEADLLDEAVLATRLTMDVGAAPVSAALEPLVEWAIEMTWTEKIVEDIWNIFETTSKISWHQLNKNLGLWLNKETEQYLWSVAFEIWWAGAGSVASVWVKSLVKKLSTPKVDKTPDSITNLAKTTVEESIPETSQKTIKDLMDTVSERAETNSRDVSEILKSFWFENEANSMFNNIRNTSLPWNAKKKAVNNDLLEVRKKNRDIINNLEKEWFSKANKKGKAEIISNVSKSLKIDKKDVDAIWRNFEQLKPSVSNVSKIETISKNKFNMSDDDIISVWDLIDDWFATKTDIDWDSYRISFNEEWKKLLNKIEGLISQEKLALTKDWLVVNKDRFDNIYSESSIKINNNVKRNNQASNILKQFKTWDRDYNALALSIADFELWKWGKTTWWDIVWLLNKINDKYQLWLGRKINNIYNPATWVIDKNKLKKLTTELAEIKKNEFLVQSKLLKAEPKNLKEKLWIQEKLFNKLYSTGFKEGTIKEAQKSKTKIDKLKADKEKAISKIKETDKVKRAEIRDKYDAKIKAERLRTRTAEWFRQVLISGLRKLWNRKDFHWNMPNIISKIASTKTFNAAKSPKQIEKIIEDIHWKVLSENIKGLNKAIRNELKDFWRAQWLKSKSRKKYNAEEYETLRGYKLMFEKVNIWDALADDLQNFLDEIKDVKELAKTNLKKKRVQRAIDTNTTIEEIKKEGITSLWWDDIRKGYWKKRSNRFWKYIQRYNNSLNYTYRVFEKIWGWTSSTFYKLFWNKTDEVYNDYQNYINTKVDPLVIELDKKFKNEKQRMDAGAFLVALRTKHINNKDWSVTPVYEWIEAMKWDPESALNTPRKTQFQADVPEGLPFPQDIWLEIRDTKLWEILEKWVANDKYKWLQENIGNVFNELWDKVAKVSEDYDNIPLYRVNNYAPLLRVNWGVERIQWGFWETVYQQRHIKNGFLRQTTWWEAIEYQYDIAKLLKWGANNEAYYSYVRPHYEKLKDIYLWRKIPKDKIKEFDSESLERLWITETVNNITGELEYRQNNGISKDMWDHTKDVMRVFFDRLANNWDQFDTYWHFVNKTTAYINNQILWLSATATPKQFLSLLDWWGIVWYRNLSWATMRSLDFKTNKKMKEASAVLRNRMGAELSMAEIESEISWGWKLRKWLAKYQKLGMLPIRLADQATASRIWLWAYRKYLLDNQLISKTDEIVDFKNKEAITYADDLMQRSVSTVNPLALPSGYSNALVRVFGQLMSTQLNRIWIITRDMPNMVKNKEYRRAAITTVSYLTSSFWDKAVTAAVWYYSYQLWLSSWEWYDKEFVEILFWGDEEENLQKLWEYVVSEFVGWRAAASMFSWDDMTVIWGYMKRIARDVTKVVEWAVEWDTEKAVNWLMKTMADSFWMYPWRASYNFYENNY